MKFKIVNSNFSEIREMDIYSIKQLKDLYREFGEDLVICFRTKKIIIYDGYLE